MAENFLMTTLRQLRPGTPGAESVAVYDDDVPTITDLPDVSQPMPLAELAPRSPFRGISVTELTELEARALCAREDIPVFWPRQNQRRHAA